MKILEVINKHHFSTHSLAKALNIKQSSIMSVVKDGANPTVNTLRNMAAAMKMPVWEFFEDEMTLEDLEALIARRKQDQETPAADALPFKDNEQKQETVPGVVVCPHCKSHFVAEITFKEVE